MVDTFYQEALKEARLGLAEGGIPIGAILVHKGKVIGRGHNQRVQAGSVIRHGETDCLERAGRYPASVYLESKLYTTLSPCSMCSGAILLYKIPHVIIGENINFTGEEEHLKSRGVNITVLNDPESVEMMKSFINNNPTRWNEDIREKENP